MRTRLLRGGIVTVALWACSDTASRPDPGRTMVYTVGATDLTGLAAVNVVGGSGADLVMVARSDLSVRILPDSARGFGAALAIPAGNDARRVAVGDVNGDGVPDLLVVGHDNSLNVRLGTGHAQFGPVTRYDLRNHANYLAVLDLNGDSYADVVVVHDGSGNPVFLTAFLGSATGALHQAWELGTIYFTSMGIATGDFDGDGKADVAVALGDNRASALVFFGLGTGEFRDPVVLATVSPDPGLSDGTTAIAAGDLDGDGRDDLVIACYAFTNQLVVRLGLPSGFSDPVTVALPSPVAIALGDLNDDGRLDVVAANIEQGTLSILHGRGDGSFGAPVSLPAGPEPSSVAVADLDGDGLADIAVADLLDHTIRVFWDP